MSSYFKTNNAVINQTCQPSLLWPFIVKTNQEVPDEPYNFLVQADCCVSHS